MIRHPLLAFALVASLGLPGCMSHAARDLLVNAKAHECRDLAHVERESCIRDAEESGRAAERQLEEIEHARRHEAPRPRARDDRH